MKAPRVKVLDEEAIRTAAAQFAIIMAADLLQDKCTDRIYEAADLGGMLSIDGTPVASYVRRLDVDQYGNVQIYLDAFPENIPEAIEVVVQMKCITDTRQMSVSIPRD